MRGAFYLALVLLALAAGPARAADQTVSVADFAFAPTNVAVAPGETVTWRFTGSDGNHSITAVDGAFDSDPGTSSPQHPTGFEFKHTFPAAGTFRYQCKVHSFMEGRVVVGTADTTAPVVSGLKASQTSKTAKFRFKLDEPATIAGKVKLTKSAGSGGKTSRKVELDGKKGTNTLKVSLKGLRPGRYKLTMRATDEAGNKAKAVAATFSVPVP